MENTVTISVKEFDELRNAFENSKLKNKLEATISFKEDEISNLKKEIENIKKSDFFYVEYFGFSLHKETFFRKDKTPLWIKKIFN